MPFNLRQIDLKSIDFKDKKTQTTILITLLGAIVLILYIYFIFLPQVAKDIGLIGKIMQMKNDLKGAQLLIAEKVGLEKRFAAYSEKIDLYEKKLPAQKEIPNLLEDLSSMARNANITIIGIMPTPLPAPLRGQKEKKGQVYQETPILITAKSGYHELGHFLSNLESGDRFMKVVDISVRANAAAPKKHDVELMVHTYVLPAE